MSPRLRRGAGDGREALFGVREHLPLRVRGHDDGVAGRDAKYLVAEFDASRAAQHRPHFLAKSARIFDQLRRQWSKALGAERLRALEDDLRKVVPAHVRLDMPGWIGG